MSRPQFRCLRYLNLDLHGLIFEMSVQNWQDQPGFSHAHRTPSARTTAHSSSATAQASHDTRKQPFEVLVVRIRRHTHAQLCTTTNDRTTPSARATPPTAPALAATSTALVLSFLCINSPWSPFTYARISAACPRAPSATRLSSEPERRTTTTAKPELGRQTCKPRTCAPWLPSVRSATQTHTRRACRSPAAGIETPKQPRLLFTVCTHARMRFHARYAAPLLRIAHQHKLT